MPFLPSVIKLNVVILSAIMLTVVAPLEIHKLILMPIDKTSLFYFRQGGTFHQQSGAKKLLSSSCKTPGDKSYKTFFCVSLMKRPKQRYDTQHYDIQPNDIKMGFYMTLSINDTQHNWKLGISMLYILLSVFILNVAFYSLLC